MIPERAAPCPLARHARNRVGTNPPLKHPRQHPPAEHLCCSPATDLKDGSRTLSTRRRHPTLTRRSGESSPRVGEGVRPPTAGATAHSCLVWIGGDAPRATLDGRSSYFQGDNGTPRPFLLTRHAGRGPFDQVASQVLALSKMDWNNDALYDALPCTVAMPRYSHAPSSTSETSLPSRTTTGSS